MRTLKTEELALVAGAGVEPASTKNPKGNNGWGNGAEGTNAGSDSGGTASSKSDEALPSGPGPAKFDTR